MKELNVEFILKNDYSGTGTTTEESIEDLKNGKSEFFAYHDKDGETNLVISDQLQYLAITDLTIDDLNKQFSSLLELSINTVFDEVVEVTSPYFEVVNDKLVVYVYVSGRFRILIMNAVDVTNITMKPWSEANPMDLTNPNFIKKGISEAFAVTDIETYEEAVQLVINRVQYGYKDIVLFGDMFFNNRYSLDSKELVDIIKKILMDIVNPAEEPEEVYDTPVEEPQEEPEMDIATAEHLNSNTEE